MGGFSQCAPPDSVIDPNPSCVLNIVLPDSPSWTASMETHPQHEDALAVLGGAQVDRS